MLTSLLHMLLYATHCVCAAPGGEPEAELLPPAARLDGAAPLACNAGIEQAREARLWCMKLLAQLLQAFPAPSHFAPYLPLLFAAAAPVMQRMHTHYTQSPAGLLVTVLAIAQQPARRLAEPGAEPRGSRLSGSICRAFDHRVL